MSINFANPNIKHVFVLMLENRSYDHMLGFFNDNISRVSNNDISGKTFFAKRGAQNVMPRDPGHEFLDVIEVMILRFSCNNGCAGK